jgi:hypothetical protein
VALCVRRRYKAIKHKMIGNIGHKTDWILKQNFWEPTTTLLTSIESMSNVNVCVYTPYVYLLSHVCFFVQIGAFVTGLVHNVTAYFHSYALYWAEQTARQLPNEIILMILLKLDIEGILKMRRVSVDHFFSNGS